MRGIIMAVIAVLVVSSAHGDSLPAGYYDKDGQPILPPTMEDMTQEEWEKYIEEEERIREKLPKLCDEKQSEFVNEAARLRKIDKKSLRKSYKLLKAEVAEMGCASALYGYWRLDPLSSLRYRIEAKIEEAEESGE